MFTFSTTQDRFRSMTARIVESSSDPFAEGKQQRNIVLKLFCFFFCFSIFIRDSTNCVLATVCQQFRTRDCRDIQVFLSCISQPIIESSHNIKFACLTLNYEQLSEQYRTAGISPWNNNWGNIHDFTKIPDMKNYSLFNEVKRKSKKSDFVSTHDFLTLE